MFAPLARGRGFFCSGLRPERLIRGAVQRRGFLPRRGRGGGPFPGWWPEAPPFACPKGAGSFYRRPLRGRGLFFPHGGRCSLKMTPAGPGLFYFMFCQCPALTGQLLSLADGLSVCASCRRRAHTLLAPKVCKGAFGRHPRAAARQNDSAPGVVISIGWARPLDSAAPAASDPRPCLPQPVPAKLGAPPSRPPPSTDG